MIENRKAQIVELIIPLAIGISILVLIIGSFIGVLSSTKLKFLAVGVTGLVLILVKAVPAYLQGNATRQKTGFLLAMVIIFLGIAAAPYLGLVPNTFVGGSTLSLSQANLQSNYANLNGPAWLLTFSAGKLGQSYTGTFSPQDVDAVTTDASTTTKPFSIQVEYDDQTCSYPIQQSTDFKITKLTYSTYSINLGLTECSNSNAVKKGYTNVIGTFKPSLSNTCYVIQKSTEYTTGTLGNGNVDTKYTINLDAGTSSGSLTIDPSKGAGAGPIGNFAYAQWNGNLVSGNSCPSTSNYRAVYDNGAWKTTSSTNYQLYLSKYTTTPAVGASAAEITKWVSDVNTYADAALSSRTFGTIDNKNSITNGIVSVPLSSPLQFPVTSLYIKASTVGIYTPSPKIEITSVTPTTFETGNSGFISAKITNTGESGNYNVYAKCEAPFTGTQNKEGTLASGASKTITIPISASADKKTSAKCTVFVDYVGGQDSEVVTVTVTPIVSCTISGRFCEGNTVFECSSDGVKKNVVTTCLETQMCSNGGCVTDEDASPGSSAPSPVIKADCDAKAAQYPWLGYTYKETQSEVCGLWCKVGISQSKTVTDAQCVSGFAPYYAIGGIIVALVIIGIFTFKKPKRR